VSDPITGGCQCGAVRYALHAKPKSTVCHCRMCQRATGGVFAALCMVKKTELEWTRGEPAFYASSNVAKRGFCPACGTPLTFAYDDEDRIEVTTGSLDDPFSAGLIEHFGVESKMPWLKLCDGLPEHRTEESVDSPVNAPGFVSLQSGDE
jgi:hypothetical protein